MPGTVLGNDWQTLFVFVLLIISLALLYMETFRVGGWEGEVIPNVIPKAGGKTTVELREFNSAWALCAQSLCSASS